MNELKEQILKEVIDSCWDSNAIECENATENIMQLIETYTDKKCNELVEPIIDAFTIEGSHPDYHRQQKRRLETEWGSLYFAIRELTNKEIK